MLNVFFDKIYTKLTLLLIGALFQALPFMTYGAITLLSDDFTGTTINTSKWVEFDTAGSGGIAGNIQQNGSLTIANSNTGGEGTTALVSVNSFDSANLEVSAVLTSGGKTLLGYGDRVYTAINAKAYLIYLDTNVTGLVLGLAWNNTTLRSNVSCGAITNGATYKMKVIPTGFEVYKNGVLACTVTPGAGNLIDTKPIFLASNDATASTFDNIFVEDIDIDSVPNAPTIGTAGAGNGQVTVSFTPPEFNGGSAITNYTVTSSPGGITASGSASPIIVTGLTNGTPYTFTVTATNAIGTSAASSASNSVTPSTATIFDQASIWFKADAITGLSDGESVTTWTDSSTNGLNATQASPGSKPTYKTAIINSKPVVRFDGNDYVNTVSNAASAGMTVFTVAKSANTTSSYFLTLGADSQAIIHGFGSAIWEYFNTPRTTLANISTSSFQIITSRVGSIGTGVTTLGAFYSGVAPWSGDVAEVIIYKSVLSNDDYNTVYNYLSNKYFPSSAPDAPTIGTATAGDTQASVAFTAPAFNGGSAITNYTVTSSPGGITASGSASPIIVTGLTNGTPYTFTVTATNAIGTSAASSASNSVTPHVPGPPSQVAGLTVTGVNKQVLLSWTAPTSDFSISDYLVEYKLASGSTWSTFSDGVSTSTKAIVTGLLNSVSYDFRVSAVSSAGTGTASSVATTNPVAITSLNFVFTGESNSGGQASNSAPTAEELAATPEVQILNNTSLVFQALDVGTNNNIDHYNLPANTTHGFEIQLANSTKANAFPDNPQIQLIKTGQGGSTLSQWNVGGAYWTKFLQRTAAAKSVLPSQKQWVVWSSMGINDFIAGTTAAAFKAAMIAHINKIKDDLPGAIIIMTQFQSMSANSGYPTYNAAMAEIAATEANVYVVDTTGAALDDGNHWSYAGLKTVGTSMVTLTKDTLGLIYPGTPTTLVATPSSTQVSLSWTAPVADGGASITDYLIEYKVNTDSSWTTFSDGVSTSTSATVTGLSGSTNYDFRVSGVNSNGAGNPVSGSVSTNASPVTISSATGGAVFLGLLTQSPHAQTEIVCKPGDIFSSVTGMLCTTDKITKNITNYIFTRDLKFGTVHSEVKLLQTYLNNNGFIVSKTGAGSKGKETTVFGYATLNALIRFQKFYSITPSVGYFGPKTRAFVGN